MILFQEIDLKNDKTDDTFGAQKGSTLDCETFRLDCETSRSDCETSRSDCETWIVKLPGRIVKLVL